MTPKSRRSESEREPDELTNLDLHEQPEVDEANVSEAVESSIENLESDAEVKKIEEDQIPCQAVVLTGGIDSTVMLYMINETMSNRFGKFKILPVILKSENSDQDDKAQKAFINKHLNALDIHWAVKEFTLGPKHDSIEQVLAWAEAQGAQVIQFAANGNESEANLPGKNFADYQQMRMLNPDIQIGHPLITVSKTDIIKWAVDKYQINLMDTLPPYFPDNAFGKQNREDRAKAFKAAWSDRLGKWIVDPYATKPVKQEDKGKAKGSGKG